MDLSPYAKFFRTTGKHPAVRYGRPLTRLGPGVVVAITHDEWSRFRRGYNRQALEGAIEFVTGDDYLGFRKKRETAARESAKKADAAGADESTRKRQR